MKRNLVVTSSTPVRVTDTVELDAAIEVAAAGERARLQAYLYGHSTLVAVVHEVQASGAGNGHAYTRVVQRALVTVEGNDPADARYRADYQGGRLQSGSFGVIDYVEDEMAARDHVGIADTADEPTTAEALEYAISALDSEAVLGSLGLDGDYDFGYSTITENGVERPYTEADQAKDIARHEKIIELLRDLFQRETGKAL